MYIMQTMPPTHPKMMVLFMPVKGQQTYGSHACFLEPAHGKGLTMTYAIKGQQEYGVVCSIYEHCSINAETI